MTTTNHEQSPCQKCGNVYRREGASEYFYCARCNEMWSTFSVPYGQNGVVVDDDLISRLAHQLALEYMRASIGFISVPQAVSETLIDAGASAIAESYRWRAREILFPSPPPVPEKIPENPLPGLPG